jgi:hypothetical protein
VVGRFDSGRGRLYSSVVNVEEHEPTESELRERAELLANSALGVSAAEAWVRLARGLYAGTIFASKMSAILFLLEGKR